MGILTIAVPPGLRAGDEMAVEALDGQTYNVIVPDGVEGGMSIEVDLPGGPDEAAGPSSSTQPVEICVPDGVYEGQPFTVDFNGVNFEIVCPDGCGPGDNIVVELPAADDPPPPPAEPPAADGPSIPDQGAHFKFKPGQRVELIRTGKGDDEVTSSGNIVYGFEGVFDVCYKIKLDNGLYKEAVAEDEISDQVTSDMGDLFGEW